MVSLLFNLEILIRGRASNALPEFQAFLFLLYFFLFFFLFLFFYLVFTARYTSRICWFIFTTMLSYMSETNDYIASGQLYVHMRKGDFADLLMYRATEVRRVVLLEWESRVHIARFSRELVPRLFTDISL